MRTFTESIFLCVLSCVALVVSSTVLASGAPPPVDRAEQRSSLFLSGTAKAPTVSAKALERLEASSGGAEVLYSRWAQLGDFNPMTAKPGDGIRIEVIPNEVFELVVLRVDQGRHSGTKFVSAGFDHSGYVDESLFLEFKPTGVFSGGHLKIPWQSRKILFKADSELPGWARVSEINLATEPELGNDLVVVDESKSEDRKEPETGKH